MRSWAASLVVVLAAFAAPAHGAPTIWDAVADPSAAVADRVLRDAELHRAPPGMPRGLDPKIDALLDQQTAIVFEMRGGTTLRGTEVRYFYGDLLIGSHAGREADGRRVLLDVLAESPNHPLAAKAWFSVAIASNMVGDTAMEREAYGRALEREWDLESRSRIHLNRGETLMLAGELEAAEEDYERSLAETKTSEGYALAHWGLGVCLARAGDLPGALEHARTAAALRFPGLGDRRLFAIDLPGVFFTPAHEIHYYRALGLLALSREMQPPDAEVALAQALSDWDEYLEGARAAGERWVPGAVQQRAYTERALEAANRASRAERAR